MPPRTPAPLVSTSQTRLPPPIPWNACGRALLNVSPNRQADVDRNGVSVPDFELRPHVDAGDQLEVVRVVRAERQDHRALHAVDRSGEHLRAAERAASVREPLDRDPGLVPEDLELRELAALHAQVQGALEGLVPELAAELLSVPALLHVERALAEAARGGAADRQAPVHLEDPMVVRVLLPQELEALRGHADALLPRRQVALQVPGLEELEDPLRRGLLAHADRAPEVLARKRDVFLPATEEGDVLQRVDVVRLRALTIGCAHDKDSLV